jgi:hypothetical protein
MRQKRLERSGGRLIRLFGLMGGLLWLVSALFVTWAFQQDPPIADWALMHRQKLQAAIGVGLAGIGTLFICFAALMFVIRENHNSV